MGSVDSKSSDDISLLRLKLMLEKLVDPASGSKFAGKVLLAAPIPGQKSKVWVLPPGILGSLAPTDGQFAGSMMDKDGKQWTTPTADMELAGGLLAAVLEKTAAAGGGVPVIRTDTLRWQDIAGAPAGTIYRGPTVSYTTISAEKAQAMRELFKRGASYVATVDVIE